MEKQSKQSVRKSGIRRASNRTPIVMKNSYREDFPEVYDFYKDIAPEIRKRELGVEKLPDNEQKAFSEILEIPLVYKKFGYPGQYPVSKGWKWLSWIPGIRSERINIDPYVEEPFSGFRSSSVAHEVRHALARRISLGDSSKQKLNTEYNFKPRDVSQVPVVGPIIGAIAKNEEQATTNKEHQFRHYMNLRKELGRAPQSNEYFDSLKNKSISELFNARFNPPVNGYQQNGDSHIKTREWNPENYRDSMMNVTKNMQNERITKKASNVAANISDWWLNTLNKLHLIPANAATLIRDISAKQLGDSNFTPRPLTISNFTDAELDALHSLAANGNSHDGKYDSITGEEYGDIGKGVFYGDEKDTINNYLNPLRVISTTLGKATVKPSGNDHIIHDIYDFNGKTIKLVDAGDGRYIDAYGMVVDKNAIKDYMQRNGANDDWYGRMRTNARKLGHRDTDPDKNKIKTELSINEIKKKLGKRIGSFDITKPVDKKDFVMRSAAAGALTGAPIGAILGGLSGAIRLLDKKKRKEWLKTMLTHIAIGSLVASATGGIGGGIMASNGWGMLTKKSEYKKYNKKSRKERIKSAIIASLAYSAPLAVLGGVGLYSNSKFNKLTDEVFAKADPTLLFNGVRAVQDMSEANMM